MPFTPVTSWDHLQDVYHANEIVAAYSERRQAIGQSAIDPIAARTDAQSKTFWLDMQQWIQTYCSSFVDHTATIEGASSIPMFTWTTFKAASGLYNGWRYATAYDPTANVWTNPEDAMYGHGNIAKGHIRGPWCFQDLQKALDALRWTKSNDVTLSDADYWAVPDNSYWSSYAIALANSVSRWSNEFGWQEAEYPAFYGAGSNVWNPNGVSWAVGLSRARAAATFTGLSECVAHSADAYMVVSTYTDHYGELSPYNPDSLSLDVHIHLNAYSELKTPARFLPKLIYEDAPIPPDDYATGYAAFYVSGSLVIVLKWSFSHTL